MSNVNPRRRRVAALSAVCILILSDMERGSSGFAEIRSAYGSAECRDVDYVTVECGFRLVRSEATGCGRVSEVTLAMRKPALRCRVPKESELSLVSLARSDARIRSSPHAQDEAPITLTKALTSIRQPHDSSRFSKGDPLVREETPCQLSAIDSRSRQNPLAIRSRAAL
jgi:hypothetical protein